MPFEDSYFPGSHGCHTRPPAILRLSLHCGNHNYTCGCLLIAARSPDPSRPHRRPSFEDPSLSSLVLSSSVLPSSLFPSRPPPDCPLLELRQRGKNSRASKRQHESDGPISKRFHFELVLLIIIILVLFSRLYSRVHGSSEKFPTCNKDARQICFRDKFENLLGRKLFRLNPCIILVCTTYRRTHGRNSDRARSVACHNIKMTNTFYISHIVACNLRGTVKNFLLCMDHCVSMTRDNVV